MTSWRPFWFFSFRLSNGHICTWIFFKFHSYVKICLSSCSCENQQIWFTKSVKMADCIFLKKIQDGRQKPYIGKWASNMSIATKSDPQITNSIISSRLVGYFSAKMMKTDKWKKSVSLKCKLLNFCHFLWCLSLAFIGPLK